MINSEEGLRRTREAVALLESVLESLERDREKIHPDRYAIMVEAPREQLQELQEEIDQYLGVVKPSPSEATAALTVPG